MHGPDGRGDRVATGRGTARSDRADVTAAGADGASGRGGGLVSDAFLLATGIGVGVALSAPVGPVNILCLQRAFRSGLFAGLAGGLGAVLADGVFAAVAAYGLTAVSGFVEGHSRWLQAIAGVLLVVYGLRVARAHPHIETGPAEIASLPGTAAASFGMTLTNPATILGLLALFGSLGDLAPAPGDWIGAGLFVAGVLAGGSAWWVGVSLLVALLRDAMSDAWLARINAVAGALLMIFGAAMLLRAALP